MPEKENRWGNATNTVVTPRIDGGPADLPDEERKHVTGFRFVYGLAPQEPVVQVRLGDQNSGFQTFHIPLPDAMYLLGALQHVQQETEAEIPSDPPALAK
ncbi:hypothetical protein C5748_23780 [Phyllobacterium phragmitis]|uniref:Uncharacterized protein n=1 Tax=Phyllobacterium phragmitis TaxID=2670329 RepID=A0A2S9IKG9_9HYPH|nr:hypothetical protein [Phyllobacterium phragmitis]PRD41005.1 hypothetical protein C5748_23780 [Phyllobacterium phragmitis]